jgi:hypothetical protein
MVRRHRLCLFAAALALASLPTVAAHGGAIGGQRETLAIPFWLFLTTGGGVVGASFLLASFATDRSLIAAIHDYRRVVPLSGKPMHLLVRAGGAVGLLALSLVVVTSTFGPQVAAANVAILLVWVGWWAGMPMAVYLVGNVWTALNPWRPLARLFGSDPLWSYPRRLGRWPAVAGLLVLIWLEVVSPVADDPQLLGMVVVAYTVVAAVVAAAVGADAWLRLVDPITNVFRWYGRFAPFRRTADGFEFALPGVRLADPDLLDGPDDVAFVVALLWVTTYDGLVSTPTWAGVTRWLVGLGAAPLLVYLGTLVVGFVVFWGGYRLAVRLLADYADTYVSLASLRAAFAPSLVPIAVGYHIAHFLGYLLTLWPSLLAALTHPLSVPPRVPVIVLPPWFGAVPIAFVLLGHLLAVWVAHATAFEVFPDRVQAIRSQYPLVAVMVFYTMVSLWIVSRPSVALPYL